MDEQTDIGGSYRLDTRDGRPALIGDPNGQWVSRGRLQGALRELSALRAQLAECYRLSGADPDGNDDAHLARYAVQEVRRLREEADETSAQLARAERERDDARTERVEALQRIGTLEKALADLIIDANRLCDRGLGGTYEDDCRLSLAKARHALSPERRPAPPVPVRGSGPIAARARLLEALGVYAALVGEAQWKSGYRCAKGELWPRAEVARAEEAERYCWRRADETLQRVKHLATAYARAIRRTPPREGR